MGDRRDRRNPLAGLEIEAGNGRLSYKTQRAGAY